MKQLRHHKAKAVPSHGAAFVVTALALSLSVLVVSSCATKEQVVKVEERVQRLEAGRTQTQASMNRLDSLTREATKGKTGDYAKFANLIQSLSDRIDELTNSVADLQDRLNFVQSRQGQSGGSGTVSQTDGNSSNSAGVDCTQMYDDSFILVRKSEYESARAGFLDYLEYCKNTDLADNAQYWIAESYYSGKKYSQAVKEFTTLIEKYPDSEKRPTALYKLGRCSEELGKLSAAVKYYTAIVNGFPETNEAGLAKGKLSELKGDARNRGGK